MKNLIWLAAAATLSCAVASPALAVEIGDGTISVANLYVPTVDLSASPATYTASFGTTFSVLGTGSFAGVTGLTGQQNGTLSFSSIVGETINQTVANFFTFADGRGTSYSFTPTSVLTRTYNVTPGITSSISLYLLGTTSNAALGFDPTATSLTLSLNSTGSSPYSSASTLAIPPAGAVPEPASWALMIGGFGLVGGTLRRRRAKVTTQVHFA